MRTAIYCDGSVWQLVLTPENKWEEGLINAIVRHELTTEAPYGRLAEKKASVLRGSFYETQGGWLRQGTGKDSLIVRFESKRAEAGAEPEGGVE